MAIIQSSIKGGVVASPNLSATVVKNNPNGSAVTMLDIDDGDKTILEKYQKISGQTGLTKVGSVTVTNKNGTVSTVPASTTANNNISVSIPSLLSDSDKKMLYGVVAVVIIIMVLK